MKIIVCMKLVPDPEGPQDSFEVDSAGNRVVVRGLPPVANPYDENALEAAIRIKEALAEPDGEGNAAASITLLSMGKSLSRAVLLKAMAAGVDDSLLVEGDDLDAQRIDSFTTATLLAAAIRGLEFDLVLTGRQASDTNSGQVGLGIAQLLGIPAVTIARKVEVSGGRVLVERLLPDGYELVEAPLPALVTVSHEVGDLRYPQISAIKAAKQLPRSERSPEDLGITVGGLGTVERVGLAAPSRERNCEMVSGETPGEAGARLAERLHADRVV
jgi:electron transfer flavoprotein beta subunit